MSLERGYYVVGTSYLRTGMNNYVVGTNINDVEKAMVPYVVGNYDVTTGIMRWERVTML